MISNEKVSVMIYIRLLLFLLGLMTLSLGISITINVQYLGLHPWDVLGVGLYEKIGLSIGSWGIIIGIVLTMISFILDRSYVKVGTFINIIVVGLCIDLYLWLDFLPHATHTWIDIVIIIVGMVIMGIGGGIYNSVRLGAGPRDGFMLSISDKTGMSIGKVRIITETIVLLLGLLIGGPVFIFSFLFTFVQSPIFQLSYEKFVSMVKKLEKKYEHKESTAV